MIVFMKMVPAAIRWALDAAGRSRHGHRQPNRVHHQLILPVCKQQTSPVLTVGDACRSIKLGSIITVGIHASLVVGEAARRCGVIRTRRMGAGHSCWAPYRLAQEKALDQS
jgi:hypothetical protein